VSRFVKPEVTTIPISDGDVLTVRKRLTYGEQTDSYAQVYTDSAEGRPTFRPEALNIAMVTAYLVDWTVKDDSGAVVPIRGLPPEELRAILRNLDPLDFEEIKDAIDAHASASHRARLEKKTIADGASKSAVTSRSAA
jgi:hypothetical protein